MDCPGDDIAWARSAFRFTGPARAAIHRLKFGGLRSIAEALAAAMFALEPPDVEVVTWVPLSRERLASRGFDQAKALALPLSRSMRRPAKALLARNEASGPQARRAGAERRTALAASFSIAEAGSPPQRVLLVDDVITTGATAAACARALRVGGVGEVRVMTAARSFGSVGGRGYTREQGSRLGLWLPGDPPR
jgi:ComF family protein